MACSYIDIKRIRDQKQLGVLSEKVKRYEKLLKQLETETDHSTARKIKRGLAVRRPPVTFFLGFLVMDRAGANRLDSSADTV